MTSEEAWAALGTPACGDYRWLTLPGRKVQARLFLATTALAQANVRYALMGRLAVAAWVRTVDEGADRGSPNVDLLVVDNDVDRTGALCPRSSSTEGSFASVRVLPLCSEARCNCGPSRRLSSTKTPLSGRRLLDGVPTVDLDDLVRAKLALWRRVERVHLRDLIGTELIPIGLVDATWVKRPPAPLARRLKELLDDPEG